VGSVKQYALDADSRVAFYTPYQQEPYSTMYLTVRTTSNPLALATAVTDAARAMDPNTPIYEIKTMEQRLSESLARRRFAMLALGLFALAAMLLAAVGVYGVMSYTVAQRTREIGIRVALGAKSGDVLKLVVGQGMALAGVGVGAGLAVALLVTRVMTGLLFNISAIDPVTFVGIGLLLTGVALLACYVPARRAVKVDPMIALRYE
jgi:putative ABC transport system permease protein